MITKNIKIIGQLVKIAFRKNDSKRLTVKLGFFFVLYGNTTYERKLFIFVTHFS